MLDYQYMYSPSKVHVDLHVRVRVLGGIIIEEKVQKKIMRRISFFDNYCSLTSRPSHGKAPPMPNSECHFCSFRRNL